jgi:hypothetical protein
MKRSPGRPPLDDDDESVPVHVQMTHTLYQHTSRRAKAERVTVQEIIRRDVQAASRELKNSK